MQIRVAKYDQEKTPHYSVFASRINDPHIDYKGIFGKLNAVGGAAHLARFLISESSTKDIAACMKLIGGAIATETRICDLSAMGDQAAWDEAWTLIDWEREYVRPPPIAEL